MLDIPKARAALLVSLALTGLLPAEDRTSIRTQIEQRTGKTIPAAAPQPRRPFSLPPSLTLSGELTADQAVEIALWNNAALESSLAAIGIAEADLADAKLLRNPNIQTLLPVGLKPFEFLLSWPIEDLWQRKRRVLAAQQNLDAVATALVQNGLNLVRDVRVTHADLWLAERRGRVLLESAAVRERIAELTRRRLDAGDASGMDLTLAETDARSTAELAARAVGDAGIVRARLRVLLGMKSDGQPILAKADARSGDLAEPGKLVETAFASRPDLRAAELAIEASAYRAKWQRSRVLSLVMPMLSVKETGTPLKARAGPGLQIEIPFFNRNQGQIARADADVIQSAWRYAALRDQVEGEVNESLARLDQARESLNRIRAELIPKVKQGIAQMETAHKDGDASYLNVLEAVRQRFDADLREADSEAALARAYAELERAVGKKL
ncbi:MAG: TolC family protein [Bryobacteraceae bacterium]